MNLQILDSACRIPVDKFLRFYYSHLDNTKKRQLLSTAMYTSQSAIVFCGHACQGSAAWLQMAQSLMPRCVHELTSADVQPVPLLGCEPNKLVLMVVVHGLVTWASADGQTNDTVLSPGGNTATPSAIPFTQTFVLQESDPKLHRFTILSDRYRLL